MERITLSELDKLIKHYLVKEFYERGIPSMCIMEFLPLCAALLFPYRDKDWHYEEKDGISAIIIAIKKFTRNKSELNSYSLEGLRLFFKYKWVPTLEFKTQILLVNGISLIEKVESNGFFSLNGNQKVLEAYLHLQVLDISQNYGNKTFVIPEENTSVNDDNSSIEDINTNNNPEIIENQETISLTPLKEFLYTNISSGLKADRYFWEYKLNTSQYQCLKEILLDLNLGNNTKILKKDINGYGTIARVVALFVSEWYKRECESLDGDRCLESIGLSSGNSGQVWKYSGLPDSFLHQENEENRMRQIAMCTLGGLPLQYVNKSRRFKEFVNGLFDIYQKEETSDEDIENVVNCFDDNNGVFKRSLKSGSCKRYLINIVNYLESGESSNLPFNERDLESPIFSEFIKKLQEGYDQELPKHFFAPEIRIWTHDQIEEDDESNFIECEFYVHIGLHKNKNVITEKELSKLGIYLPSGTNSFNIHLKTTYNNGNSVWSKEYRTYFKIGNHCNDFCGAFGSDIATTINFHDVKDISLCIEYKDSRHEIPLFTMKHYLELYSTDDYYLWTTKKNNAARKVLFFDSDYYTLQTVEDLDIQKKSNESYNWIWIYQKGSINLIDHDGEILEFTLGASELISVNFRTKELRKNIVLTSDGLVQSVINGEVADPVHLLCYSHKQHLMLTCDGEKDDQLTEKYDIYFKPLNGGRYSLWTNTNCPSQGFIKMRISCRDESKKKRNWIGIVYFIPESAPIVTRNIENNFIYFKGENIYPIDESLQNHFKLTSHKFKDGPECGLNSPTISFRVGDPDNHVVIDVYRAFNWRQLWNNGSLIKNIVETTTPPPIAVILQRNIKIKVIDKDGYVVHSPRPGDYYDYFDNPSKISTKKYIDDTSRAYLRYIYSNCFEDKSADSVKIRKIERIDNSLLLLVSDKHIDKYVFYYWSGLITDLPVKLERIKLENKKYEYTFLTPLTDKAIIFQSLKEKTPNFYFRPFYADEKIRWEYYIERYKNVSIDYLIKCYQLAVEHGVYFCIFPALRVLQNRDTFTEFIRIFIQRKNYHLTERDQKNLTRLAKELSMDWFFVNRKQLFDNFDNESVQKARECLRCLLTHSPIERGEQYYSKRFIERFLQDKKKFDVRNGKLPRKFLNLLDNFDNYNGCNNVENRIAILTELSKSQENIFQKTCEILNI